MQIQLKKKKQWVQSSSSVSFYRLHYQLKRKIGKWLLTTPRYETNDEHVPWCTPQQNRMLSEFLYMQIIYEASLQQTWKDKIGSVLLALLFICPWLNRALGPWQWLRGLGFPRQGTFLQVSSIQFISLYDVFTTGQFFCILTAMVTWLSSYNLFYMKESFVSQNATTVIKWSLTTCTLLM